MRAACSALLGLALAAWLFVGTLVELAERVGLFRAPLGTSLRRASACRAPRWGMTLAHAGLAVVHRRHDRIARLEGGAYQLMRPGDRRRRSPAIPSPSLGAERGRGPNYEALRGRFAVDDARRTARRGADAGTARLFRSRARTRPRRRSAPPSPATSTP